MSAPSPARVAALFGQSPPGPAEPPPLPRSPWEILQLAPRPVALLAPEERHQLFDLLADIAWGGDVGTQPEMPPFSREFSFAYKAPPSLPSDIGPPPLPGPPGPPPDVLDPGPGGVADPSLGWPDFPSGDQGEPWPTQEQNAAAWPEDQWAMPEDRPSEKKSSRRRNHHHDRGEVPDGHRKHRSERKGSNSPRRTSRDVDVGASGSRAETVRGSARASAAQVSSAKEKTKAYAESTADSFNRRLEEAQQKVAQAAVNNYARQATGGAVTNVPAPVSNAALGYAKKNPKEAMKFAKFLM